MKKIALVLLMCGFGMSLLAQGIRFREGSWKEMLAQAKKENKLIFIDNYTSWCGPCKKMVKEIFPLQEVGDFYNTNFVCYKLDCEKGDGVEVAKTYRIFSFPTYLFVDGNGKLFYRSGGYMPAENFLSEGKVALEEFRDKRTLEEWDALYVRKKNRPEFVKAYLAKRDRSKLDNADILDQYVQVEKKENLLAPDFLKGVFSGASLKAGGACSDFILEHWSKIAELIGQEETQMAEILDFYMGHYSYDRAVKEKNRELFEAWIKVKEILSEKLGKNVADETLKLRSAYAAATEQLTDFERLAEQHADVLFREEKEALKRDAAQYREYLENMIAHAAELGGQDPDQLAFSLQFAAVNESSGLSFAFRDLAANVARLSEDRELLNKAMMWALEAIVLFDNFTNYEALAEVLYKLGYKKEAINQMQKAVDKMPAGNDAIANRVNGKLEKMRN